MLFISYRNNHLLIQSNSNLVHSLLKRDFFILHGAENPLHALVFSFQQVLTSKNAFTIKVPKKNSTHKPPHSPDSHQHWIARE